MQEIDSNKMENYYWVQIYNDNTFLNQYDYIPGNKNKIIQHSFYDIDQSKLKFFVIRKKDVRQNEFNIFALDFIPNKMKLIWYWDREVALGGSNILSTTHCFGWQETIQDKTIKVILHISPDTGSVKLERLS